MLFDYLVTYERNRSKGSATFKGIKAKKKAYAQYGAWVKIGGHIRIYSAPFGTTSYKLLESKGSKD